MHQVQDSARSACQNQGDRTVRHAFPHATSASICSVFHAVASCETCSALKHLCCLRDGPEAAWTVARSGRCFQNTVTTSEQAPAAQQGPPHAAAFRPPQPNASHAPPQKKQWLHDPGAEGSLVLSQPTGNGTPVVVDPYICRYVPPPIQTRGATVITI